MRAPILVVIVQCAVVPALIGKRELVKAERYANDDF